MSTSKYLAERLEEALRANGMLRKELSEKAGVSRQALYRLLQGSDVQVSTLLAVADVLGLDLMAVPRQLARALPEFQRAQAVGAPGTLSSTPTQFAYGGSAVEKRMLNLRANLERSDVAHANRTIKASVTKAGAAQAVLRSPKAKK